MHVLRITCYKWLQVFFGELLTSSPFFPSLCLVFFVRAVYILSLAPFLAVQCHCRHNYLVPLFAFFSATFAAPCPLAGQIQLALESVRDLALPCLGVEGKDIRTLTVLMNKIV